MKKVNHLFCHLSIFLLVFTVSVNDALSQSIQYLINEDYDSLTPGIVPPGWNIGDCAIVVQNQYSISNPNGVRVNGPTVWYGSPCYKTFENTQGIVYVEIDLKPKIGGSDTNCGVLLAPNNRPISVADVVVWKNETDQWYYLYYGSQIPFASCTGNFQHLKIAYNTGNNTYAVYLDGNLIVDNAVHSYDLSTGIAQIGVMSQRGYSGRDSYFDNLKVYKLVNPTLSIEPTDQFVSRNQNLEHTICISEATGVVGYRVALDLDPSKVTYVDGSATKVGTSTEIGWGPIVVNSASPELAIFTCASASGTILSGSASLMKFQLHINDSLPDFTPINVTFNPLTSLNEDAIAYNAEIWNATVLGPNHRPMFTGGPNQNVLEDSGYHQIDNWATNLFWGSGYESWQSLNFTLDIDNSQLFFIQPTLDASGTLRYTLASDEFGICNATAVLHDSGGTANGGIDSSTPYQFSFTVNPVNDAPSFIGGATAVVLNATGGQHEFPGWATAISAGPVNESTQTLWFNVETNHDNLFSATPSIDAGGTLRFTPAVGAHGVVKATATLYDNGGTANGGINYTSPAFFVMKIYIPFLWGDLNANGQAGAVDASLLLRYDAGLIDTFPGYPVAEYPEYYPDPTQPWNYFPLAADVNADGIAGTWDASLVLQKYVWLIQWFPADANHDQWGPDAPLPPGKAVKRSAPRTMNAILKPLENAWSVTLQIDDAEDVQGLHAVLLYDPAQLQFIEEESGWLVESGLMVFNASEPGRLLISGALGQPLPDGLRDLLTVKFDAVGNGTDPLRIEIDEEQTDINDGHIRIQLNYPEEN